MKIEVELPDDFIAWLERQPVCEDGTIIAATVADKVRRLLADDVCWFQDRAARERHAALLRLLDVEHLIDVRDQDDDIPF